ncbi:MAG TPA: hypothetical protein VFK19_06045 [Sphingomicrobium sp.]|nr:hypothetical protein [Sphingomicrobium sp.]
MKKLMLAAAGAAVALSPIAATPALARDFNGHNFGRHEQVQKRKVVKKRAWRRLSHCRSAETGRTGSAVIESTSKAPARSIAGGSNEQEQRAG